MALHPIQPLEPSLPEPTMATKKKPLTNIQLITQMMNNSAVGVLKQAFIIEAVRSYAEAQLKSEPWKESSMVSQEAWKVAAQECLDSIENRV